ncbi:YdeI/OmpD-associated family protein [Nostoc ellipsosporum NOK]|nr:YdeI/OmpD-associated family protein [Nostoc ellipsosporum NOK]
MAVQTLVQKMRIRPGQRLRLINAPKDFLQLLHPLPQGVSEVSRGAAEQWHCFVKDQQQLSQVWRRVWKKLRPGDLVWFYYPKGNSGMQTDLTRDKGWDIMNEHLEELQWNSLISFNDTWSAAGLKRVAAGMKKESTNPLSKDSPWIDRINRVVILPPSIVSLLKKHPKEAAVFEKMTFTHKREYVEWITGARKAETLQRRLDQFIEKLKEKS